MRVLSMLVIFTLLSACKSPSEGSAGATVAAELEGAPIPEYQVEVKAGQPQGGPPQPWNFWIDPESPAASAAKRLRADQDEGADLLDIIATQPVASWYSLAEKESLLRLTRQMTEAAAQDEFALMVIDGLPYRSCTADQAINPGLGTSYKIWMQKLVQAIGSGRALVIFEPTAMSSLDCLSPVQKEERWSLMRFGVKELNRARQALIYIDAGSQSLKLDEVALQLEKSGIEWARGFAINTGGYQTTRISSERGMELRKRFPTKTFVIDTGRNGKGPSPQAGADLCNPRGRALGENPTSKTSLVGLDAYLWIKQPGESDGPCDRDDPPAGAFSSELAIDLARNAGY